MKRGVGLQDDVFLIQRGRAWLVVGPAYVHEAYKLEPEVTEEVAREAMKEASFGCMGGPEVAAHMDNPVTSYSGGWKMEMHHTAAKLLKRRLPDA